MNRQIIKTVLILLSITVIAAALRFYSLDKNPISLNVDEVSVGYNAYSILRTQKDEYGNFLPLSFKSLGDYKPPLYIYLVAPSIAVFGLNEFALRFPNALISSLTIPLCYLLILQLTRSKKYAYIGSLFFAVSSWHIFYSRTALETPLSGALVMLGAICLLKSLKSSWLWSLGAAVSLSLPIYTYQTERLFVPLLITAFYLIYWHEFGLQRIKKVLVFNIIFLALTAPFIYSIFEGSGQARAQMMFISKDTEFVRNVLVKPLPGKFIFVSDSILQGGLLFFYWLQKILSYLNPEFLFYKGLNMTRNNTYGLGILYLFDLPFLILGIISLARKKITHRRLILAWILLGLVPASLTLGELNPRRILNISPMVILILSIGAVEFIRILKDNLSRFKSRFIFVLFGLFIVWNLSYAFLVFSVHFPLQQGEGLMEGTKEAVRFILDHQDEYSEVVFDPVLGTKGPYIVSVPYLYLLFYSKYDPLLYQNQIKVKTGDSFYFNKYAFRPINWRPKEDRDREGVLFIGSRWSLPEKDLEGTKILKKIYLSNGELAFIIVTKDQIVK